MINPIYHIFKADFSQRIRHQKYLVTLLGMAIITMLFFPSLDASYQTFQINNYRGIYNSAWMGATLAILNYSFLPLICFYVIKGTIEHDRGGLVGELIAATPVSKFQYVFGKWLSDLCMLLGMLFCMSLTLIFVQLWHGEDHSINLFQLILPQVIYVAPLLMAVAAVAILFESIALLRGGVGNILYFFLWAFSLTQVMWWGTGISELKSQMQQSFAWADIENTEDNLTIGITMAKSTLSTYEWQGLDYSLASFFPVLQILPVVLLILALATCCFDRFRKAAASKTSMNEGRIDKWVQALCIPLDRIFDNVTRHFAFTRLVRQELLLIMRGWPVCWYVCVIALVILQLVMSSDLVRAVVLPVSWLLCVLALSPLGQRESQYSTQELMFNSPSLLKQQFPAMIIGGILLLMVVSSGAIVRFAISSEMFSILMLVSGALFVVSLALACGTLTKTSRTFEILFTLFWYIGPLNHTPYLDFIGVDLAMSKQVSAPLVFVLISLLLLIGAFVVRRKQAF